MHKTYLYYFRAQYFHIFVKKEQKLNTPQFFRSEAGKQRAWDMASVRAGKDILWMNAEDSYTRARLLATSAPHSGDWLLAIPISSCGLRLDDEAIRIAVGLRLGCKIGEPHDCMCMW